MCVMARNMEVTKTLFLRLPTAFPRKVRDGSPGTIFLHLRHSSIILATCTDTSIIFKCFGSNICKENPTRSSKCSLHNLNNRYNGLTRKKTNGSKESTCLPMVQKYNHSNQGKTQGEEPMPKLLVKSTS